MINPPRFYCGLDLGKLQDYTAFVVIEHRRSYLGRDAVTFRHLYDWDLRVRRLRRFDGASLANGHGHVPRRVAPGSSNIGRWWSSGFRP